MEDLSFLKLYRKIQNHWIYQDSQYLHVWLEMLFNARFSKEPKTEMYNGIIYTINYGEFIFGRPSWSKRLGISERRLRTLIEKLEQENMIKKIEKLPKFTIYSIVNYEKFNQLNDQQNSAKNQGLGEHIDQQTDQQPTSNRPATDQQPTNKEECNKERREERKECNKNLVGDSEESPSAPEPTRYDIDSVYYQAALYLRGRILNFNSKCKVPKDNPRSMDKWSNDIRLILERDKRTKKELATIIDYIFDFDDFWKGQIQSPSGLRKHWDKIQGKMLANQNKNHGNKVIDFQEQIDRMADW